MIILQNRKSIIAAFLVIAILGSFLLPQLRFTFDFEQFFPEGDPDLDFFEAFIEDFEADDNFLLVAVKNQPDVFDTAFLKKFHAFSLDCRELPSIIRVSSLTQMKYPVKTPFGIATIPIIHKESPDKFERDKRRVLSDGRFVNNLINEKGDALTVLMKTKGNLSVEESQNLMNALSLLAESYDFEDAHVLGRAYFQDEMVKMQKRELTVVFSVAFVLVTIILFLLFQRVTSVLIALISIGLGLLLFVELLILMGRELNIMSAFYPILMLIVGTSDIVHIMTKYVDELKKGLDRKAAMDITIRQIGMATLLTSLTTAVGFATLLTSKLSVIREFGVNSAISVMIAYITVLLFSTSLLSMFPVDKIIRQSKKTGFWDRLLEKTYHYTGNNGTKISVAFAFIVLTCLYGMSQITTNYNIRSNLPMGEKITSDFDYFEEHFGGFRPLEFAIFVNEDYETNSYPVVREIDKIESLLQNTGAIDNTASLATIYKSFNQMSKGNQGDAFFFPEKEADFVKFKRLMDRYPMKEVSSLISKDERKTRISSRIKDIGADSIKALGQRIDTWIDNNVDGDIIEVRRTGTGLLLDKNAIYIRDSLLYGLGLALIVVSLLMALLFRNLRILFIAMVPNLIPLLFAAALLGFLGIDLEAGLSVVFAIVFGIAVDDSIHFLGKFKLSIDSGMTTEEALFVTFKETGKAIIFTSIILFFGFLIMLFSVHPPSFAIGLLISVTLVSAVVCDLLILPVLIRKFL